MKKYQYHVVTMSLIFILIFALTGCNGGEGTAPPITTNTYTITASAGSHGSISPSGNVTVNQGLNKSFAITPDDGYIINDILVDGNSVGAVSSYTFTNITQNHTISATFSAAATGPVHNLTKDTYYDTIQAALDDADSGDTIEVADGTYDESIIFSSGKVIILQSVNGASSTTIRGNNGSDTVKIECSPEGTTLKGFTITHNSDDMGRGIYNNYINTGLGYLNINNCIVSGNSVGYSGGGIGNCGILTITGSTISNNSAGDDGGGIYTDCSITITGSTISNNSADYGGGIYNVSGTLTITSSTISDNTATYSGGGIYNDGTLTIIGSTIDGNSAYDGGGIENTDSLIITESTISGNFAGDLGGGICNDGTLTITGSEISGNSSNNLGGGIYNYNGSLTITGSIISGNSARSGGGIKSYQGILTITASTISNNSAEDTCGGIETGSILTITASTISNNSAEDNYGGIYLYPNSEISTIGGSSDADKNTICGNRKGADPSLDQQIWGFSSGNLYETYKDTNYISAYCE